MKYCCGKDGKWELLEHKLIDIVKLQSDYIAYLRGISDSPDVQKQTVNNYSRYINELKKEAGI